MDKTINIIDYLTAFFDKHRGELTISLDEYNTLVALWAIKDEDK